MTRWFRRLVAGSKTLRRAAEPPAHSSQTELRLVGVERASLDELLQDYEDFLRQRGLPLWSKDDSRAVHVRMLAKATTDLTDPSDPTNRSDQAVTSAYDRYRPLVEERDGETAANTIICMIHQANYLFDRQIAALERQFIEGGGYPPPREPEDDHAPSCLPSGRLKTRGGGRKTRRSVRQ
jgi:four helix bundle suffix protein